MSRPVKWRKIDNISYASYFVPTENTNGELEEVVMFLEEVEAIRLKDMEGLNQSECAKRMEISRATFQRILTAAHRKIADALIQGKVLHIEGGAYTIKK